MGLLRLILREICYRKLNFALGALSIVVAVGCAVGAMASMAAHDRRAEQLVDARRAAAAGMMKQLQDDFRKITRGMGYNAIILPREQTLENLYADRPLPRYMPESWADTLAAKQPVMLNHLAPVLQQRILWPEFNRPVLLTGMRGEVYLKQKVQEPLRREVGPGEMIVGYALHSDPKLRLGVGQRVRFFGQEYTIAALRPQEGGPDDMGVWIHLKSAQEILGQPGQITGILALECECPVDSVNAIAREIQGILPQTQVMEFATVARARSASLERINQAAEQAAAHERFSQAQLRDERARMARVLAGVVLAAAVAWIALLTLGNVRERSVEIGILRAVGLGSRQVLGIFLGKAALMGVTGAVVGYFAGALIGGGGQGPVLRSAWLAGAMAGAPILACIATGVPALLAARRDPADMLREE